MFIIYHTPQLLFPFCLPFPKNPNPKVKPTFGKLNFCKYQFSQNSIFSVRNQVGCGAWVGKDLLSVWKECNSQRIDQFPAETCFEKTLIIFSN
jgi:hypothetical protein